MEINAEEGGQAAREEIAKEASDEITNHAAIATKDAKRLAHRRHELSERLGQPDLKKDEQRKQRM